jgi:hypothetical protein
MSWRAVLLVAIGLLGTCQAASAQNYAPPDPVWPLPLYSNRPEEGGLYLAAEFMYFRQSNPIRDQLIAIRGYFDADGTITGTVGQFVGSGNPALFADDVGPPSYQPGYRITGGWRFREGHAFEISWLHLQEVKKTGAATLVPLGFQGQQNLADTFVTSFVYNFPEDYSGPPNDFGVLPPGSGIQPGATYGIWNAADNMLVQFTQRYDQWDGRLRVPVLQTDDHRVYGIAGARVARIYEKFLWRTVDNGFLLDGITPDVGPFNAANYTNTMSNNLYGAVIGCGDECRLGDTPIGTFAVSFDAQAALFVNFFKARAKYERADRATAATRTRRLYSWVPELEGNLNLWWYPIEGVQLRVGYNAMTFFNTFSSPFPVSFNFGALDPAYERVFRLFHGLNAGIAVIF